MRRQPGYLDFGASIPEDGGRHAIGGLVMNLPLGHRA